MEETANIPNTRARLNFKQTSKGAGQMDVTTEAPTVDEASKMMGEAIDSLRKIFNEKGIKEASE